MRKLQKKRFDHGWPIAKIDTRPLAFVAMFLAIVFLMPAAQVRPHSFDINLGDGETAHPLIAGSGERVTKQYEFLNRVSVSSDDTIHWNGEFITEWQLVQLLREMQSISEQLAVEYEPAPISSYDRAVKVLYILQKSGVPFRIAGMEEHCKISDGDIPSPAQIGNRRAGSLNIALSMELRIPPPPDPKLGEYTQQFEACNPVPAVHIPN